MENNWQEILAQMSPEEQYAYFVGQVADQEVMWGLYLEKQKGWAMTRTPEGKQLLVLWTDPGQAAQHANGTWNRYRVESLDLHGFLEFGLQDLAEAKQGVSLLYQEGEGGLVVELEDLKRDLLATLASEEE
ncbi:MAG: DUF2750 domain-containing protein [Bacteroidota bacterium]